MNRLAHAIVHFQDLTDAAVLMFLAMMRLIAVRRAERVLDFVPFGIQNVAESDLFNGDRRQYQIDRLVAGQR